MLPSPPVFSGSGATAWTGDALLVWGGYRFDASGIEPPTADGFVFDMPNRRWRRMSDAPLAPRVHPAAAWTGTELLVWGGSSNERQSFDDGAAYNPRSDSWRVLPKAPLSPRAPLSVWTGTELVIWGTSVRVEPRPRDGALYTPSSNSWRRISRAPIELTDATAVWTGHEMIVFGAALHGGNFPESPTAIGARYDPVRDAWRELPDSSLSPQASTAAWDRREVITWDYVNKSAAFDPASQTWRAVPDVPLAAAECVPRSVSLGTRVFGDYCGSLVLFDREADRWRRVFRPDLRGWGFEVVAAGSDALLLGRSPRSADVRLLAYRPRS